MGWVNGEREKPTLSPKPHPHSSLHVKYTLRMWQHEKVKFRNVTKNEFNCFSILFSSIFSNISKYGPFILPSSFYTSFDGFSFNIYNYAGNNQSPFFFKTLFTYLQPVRIILVYTLLHDVCACVNHFDITFTLILILLLYK